MLDININYKKELKEAIKNKYWHTKDGAHIKLKNMKMSHLKNCIELCKRYNFTDNERILRCALAIKENRFDKFFEEDNLSNLVKIKFME